MTAWRGTNKKELLLEILYHFDAELALVLACRVDKGAGIQSHHRQRLPGLRTHCIITTRLWKAMIFTRPD